ncbi:MAG: hypothetical protein ACRDZO_08095 [Egibacteraceae bacterium]
MKEDATRDLSCIELVELVTDYLEGTLAPGRADDISPDAPDELIRAFRAWRD